MPKNTEGVVSDRSKHHSLKVLSNEFMSVFY